MDLNRCTLEIVHEDDIVIVTPVSDLREFDFAETESAASKVFKLLEEKQAKHVIIDLSKTDYYGSTALGFFVKLRKRVADQGGQMALCNISTHELEVLQVTKLDDLWPICDSSDKAIETVRSANASGEPDVASA